MDVPSGSRNLRQAAAPVNHDRRDDAPTVPPFNPDVNCPPPEQAELFDLGDLGAAERTVSQARKLHKLLFREAKRMTEYQRMLATRQRSEQFEAKLLRSARMLNSSLDSPLPDRMVATVAGRVAHSIAAWEHAPIRQRERQAKQAAKRRRSNRGRDAQIVYLRECGESERAIAHAFNMSKSGVRHVLQRDAEQRAQQAESVSSVSLA
ncbi:MAG: hypothetical protein OXQ89_16950 [Rhodospirillaceae bacterium]|nr:hypothetical protein [Rhodospirillaceae bacterium]MDE0361381.1 hypothetical protein [Rhodospirillaceae bacterium]